MRTVEEGGDKGLGLRVVMVVKVGRLGVMVLVDCLTGGIKNGAGCNFIIKEWA